MVWLHLIDINYPSMFMENILTEERELAFLLHCCVFNPE